MNDGHFICPVCRHSDFTESLPYKNKSDSPVFRNKSLVKCGSCQSFSAYPLPAERELQEYYSSYWKEELSLFLLPLFRAQAEARVDFFRQHLEIGNRCINILDIGAGFGLIRKSFGRSRLRVNYDVVEVEPIATAYLKKKIKPRHIFHSSDEVVEKYSLIILSHIIEHLANPLDFLTAQRERLQDSGVLFIEVPNQDHLYKAFNEPHLVCLNPASLVAAVERAGFSIIDVRTCGHLLKDLMAPSASGLLDVEIPVSLRERCVKGVSHFVASRRRLTKKQLMEMRNKENQVLKMKKRAFVFGQHVHDYGPDRQWIRLIAKSKNRSDQSNVHVRMRTLSESSGLRPEKPQEAEPLATWEKEL